MSEFTYYSVCFEKDFKVDEDEPEFRLILKTLEFDRQICTVLDSMRVDFIDDNKMAGKFVSKILRFDKDDDVEIDRVLENVLENLKVKNTEVTLDWQKDGSDSIGTDDKRTVESIFDVLYLRNPTLNTFWKLKGGRLGLIVAVDEAGKEFARKGVLTQDAEGLWHVEDVADQLVEMISRSAADFVRRQ